MRTIQTILQTVLNEIGYGYTPTTLQITNPDAVVVQLLALANREAADLAGACGPNQGWPILRKEYTFDTVASQEAYDFPSDYGYIIGQTEWDRGQSWPLRGPATPQEWQAIKSGFSPITPRRWFRIMRSDAVSPTTILNRIFLTPTPDGVSTIVFEYYSKYCIASASGAPKERFTSDSDVPILDDNLFILGVIWRFLRKKGLPYDEEYKEYQELKEKLLGREGASRVLPLGARFKDSILLSGENIPDTGYGS